MSEYGEPWSADSDSVFDCDGHIIAAMCLPAKTVHAKRIVACVNACAGIPDGNLEKDGVTGTLRKWHEDLQHQRDEMLALLKEFRYGDILDDGESLMKDFCNRVDKVIEENE